FLGPVLRSFGTVVLELELFNQSLLRERRVGEVALGRLQRVLVFARNLGRGRLRVGRLRLGLLLGRGLWRRFRDRVGGLRVCRGRRGQRRARLHCAVASSSSPETRAEHVATRISTPMMISAHFMHPLFFSAGWRAGAGCHCCAGWGCPW